ncbi:unnamed protein product [Arabidopsis thaliana]|uniref:Prolamin-like domain-containing protein n=2 Tax=Arabidopsis thaliana TaxID=3702 RepID=A0A654FCY4_ARATH|nr:ECA1 gametogenesis related family protein [Arabidopsis thaliana]AEE78014.1 ECA1 gametogenesis related family protein [Arabidopsis thaliana]CAA0384553.1 unnamed protein product [Arabidopsis thaliana]VYS59413.1 unnamed protein product [Arabidopsis thaliana]|eukprot:NP_001078242.1 ECA1 gametogenesis related family protein [Arabidopsis thaliana]
MQRKLAMNMIALIIMLSIFTQTTGNDLAPAPHPTIPCLDNVKTIPNCVKAVFHFKFKEITETCCTILLTLPDDCFGLLFPIPRVYHFLLSSACKNI